MSPRALQELVEYYQNHSLKESFKQLDTTLKYPYKSRERSTSRTFTRSPGRTHLSLSAALPMGNLTRSVGRGLGVNGDPQPPGSSLLPSPLELPCRAQQRFAEREEMRGSFGWVHCGCPAHVSLCVGVWFLCPWWGLNPRGTPLMGLTGEMENLSLKARKKTEGNQSKWRAKCVLLQSIWVCLKGREQKLGKKFF